MEIAILRRDLTELPIQVGSRWFVAGELLPAGKPTPWRPLPNPADWLQVVFR
jgi:hypothetical protein